MEKLERHIINYSNLKKENNSNLGNYLRKNKQMEEVVPTTEIFKLEFKILGINQHLGEQIRGVYEQYVYKLMNSVSVWTGCKELKNSDRVELKYKVNEMDEKDLFFLLGYVFYNDFKASYESNRILTNSVQSNKFNCYSSSVLFGDVLTRLGKNDIHIIKTPNHVCLSGKKFIFETTKYNKIFEKTQQQKMYPYAQNLDIKKIIGITYNWCAYIIKAKSNNKNLAMEYYNKALEIDPNHISVLRNIKAISTKYKK